jgi:hypothetical protein
MSDGHRDTSTAYDADSPTGGSPKGVSQGGSVIAVLARAETPSFRLEPGNPKVNLPQVNPIYSITMSDRRHPQFERDWRDSLWALAILLAILFLRYLTR